MNTDGASPTVFCAAPSHAAVGALLKRAGVTGSFQMQALPGGRNNRVFRVDAGGMFLLLKHYFDHPADPRNRLAAEFAWTRFVTRHGIASVPRPLACDPAEHLGLYEFVAGDKLSSGDISDEHVQQAIDFVQEVNRLRAEADARDLPVASEACFSLAQHLACVDRRLQRLLASTPDTESDVPMRLWLEGELIPAWRRIRGQVAESPHSARQNVNLLLSDEERCLSPSDFGFHNALREPSGRLRFLDFEYAGWDDPAKLVCDFFCQVELPAPMAMCNAMLAGLAAELGNGESLARRVECLLPVYRVKWCCIVLNDFLPIDGLRREFAGQAPIRDDRKQEQFARAQRLLAALEETGACR